MAKNTLLSDKDPESPSTGSKGKRKKRTARASAAKKKAGPKAAWWTTLPGIRQAREAWGDERIRTVAGLVSLALSLVFALGILSSFVTGRLDIRLIQNAANPDAPEAYHNILGSLGAHIGFFFGRQGLGAGALGIPFLLGLLGLRWLTERSYLPLAKTFRLTAFLALFAPWTLAFLTQTTPEGVALATSALDDHIIGASGLWLLGKSMHVAGFTGSAVFLIITVAVMMAFNAPSLWKGIGHRVGAWFNSGEEAMMEEDAQDEAAVQQAASSSEGPTAETKPPTSSFANLLVKRDAPSEEKAPEADQEAPSAEAQDTPDPTASNIETAAPQKPVEDVPFEVQTPELLEEQVAAPDPEPEPEPSEAPAGEAAAGDEVEFEVKEVQEEETLSNEELKDLSEEFGEEYDPTLDLGRFQLPNLDMLVNHGDGKHRVTDEELTQNKENILQTLANFKIEVSKITAEVGPTVTLYEIVPAPGIRISKIKNLEDDIALSLAALGIRIIAPIPGKGTIGIEVPNSNPDVVSMRTLIASDKFQNSDAALPIALGKTISNETYVFDMAKMPHLLMAGATGQGKSVGLNAMLVSMLYRRHPSQLKFVLVDPKKVELTLYNKIVRHYLAQLPDSEDAIITDTSKVVSTLNSLCVEMDQRYELLKAAQCRNIKEYNAKFIKRKIIPGAASGHPDNGSELHSQGHHYMPYIVLVVDEFADLIMTAGKEVETPIARLAQLARAIGIHLIIATQRPSVNIITGTIKANFPARVAFRVTSKIDSRTILDAGGADQLIGRGDLLMSTGNDLIRLQCGFVDTPEVEEICEFIGSQQGYPTSYTLPPPPAEASGSGGSLEDDERDPMFEDAARVLVLHQQGSTSLLQRKLKLGYNRAGRLIDQLETAGIIGPFEGSKARKVLVPDEASLEQMLQSSSTTTE